MCLSRYDDAKRPATYKAVTVFSLRYGVIYRYENTTAMRTSLGRCTVRRHFFGLGRSTAAQIPLMSCLSSHISRGCNRGEVYFKAHDSEGKHIHERAESIVFRGG